MRTRKTGREDIPALKALWQEAFGDEQQDIDLFFETVYPNATGFCAEDGGELVSMLFALPQTIVKEEKQLKCAYLYAVATKKDRQGEGLCSALLAYAEKELRKRYVEALLLSPASERLADFYAERGFTRQTGAKKTLLDCAQPTGQATEIGVQDYAGLRETALWDIPHVRYDRAQLEYAMAGGKFYCLMAGYAMGCAAVKDGKDGGSLSGTLTQKVKPGETCSTVTATAKEGYSLEWGFPEKTARHGACSSGWAEPIRSWSLYTWAFPWNKARAGIARRSMCFT